jgi:hypothetical protein
MAMSLPRGTILQIEAKDPLATPASTSLAWRSVTEHNRSEFSVDSLRIEQALRMSNGTLRKFHIADKKRFSVAWSMLPTYRSLTVDGYWGAEDLRQFYTSDEGKGTFRIRLNFAKDGTNQSSSGYEEYTVSFTDCSFTVVKRGIQAHWNVSMSMEEV